MNPQSSQPALSIIIVNYNTPSLTLKCIQSIYRHRPALAFEIIVIQNGSDSRLEELLTSRFAEVRFIAAGANLGFSKGVNLGVHNSKGRLIVLLNNDAQIRGPVFDRMADYANTYAHAGVIGPRHIGHDGRFQLSCGHFPTFYREIIRKLVYYRLSLNDWRLRDYLDDRHSVSGPVDWVSGSCMMVRREVLDEIGLLDERFFMYFEDIDLCARARRNGWQVHYFAPETVMHIGGASVKRNLLSALIENRRSQLYFSRKYFGRLGEALIRFVLIVKYGKNLAWWGSVFLYRKNFAKAKKNAAYEMALLAKKVITIALQPGADGARVPSLAAAAPAPASTEAPARRSETDPMARLLETPPD